MGLGYVAVKIKKKSPLHKSFDFVQKIFGKKSNDDENRLPVNKSMSLFVFPAVSVSLITFSR